MPSSDVFDFSKWSLWSYHNPPSSGFDILEELGLLGSQQFTSDSGTAYRGYEIPPPPEPRRRKPLKWEEFGYGLENAPAQWKALRPTKLNEQTEWLATMNMMIPFLSPQDQMQMANMLATQDPKNFGHLANMKMGSPSIEQQREMREQYGGRRQLLQALEALDRFRAATGKSEMGAGYKYIVDLVSRMADFSGGGAPQSRLDFVNMMSQLGPMVETAPEAYQGVTQMLLNPTFAGTSQIGQLMGSQWQWGQPNKQLWG